MSSSCISILHPGMSSGLGSTQTHGLPGDTFTSPEYSTDSVDSLSHTKLSSAEVEEETKNQGSKVSNASPFSHMQSLVTTHPDVTCASFSSTMQVLSKPVGGESDPHKEPEPATVKGEYRVAVCLSMFDPTINMRKGDADMLHHSLPTLTTANISLVCLYLCIQHILDIQRYCSKRVWVFAQCACVCIHVSMCLCVHVCMLLVYMSRTCPLPIDTARHRIFTLHVCLEF